LDQAVFAVVKLSFEGVLSLAENNQVLGPTDFSNQRLEFFVAVIGEIHWTSDLRPQTFPYRKSVLGAFASPLGFLPIKLHIYRPTDIQFPL